MRSIKKYQILLSLLLIPLASAQSYNCPGTSMMSGYYGSGFMVVSWIISLLIIGLIIVGIYWLIKSANRK